MKKPLSETDPLTLMISSRCADEVYYQGKLQPLRVLREAQVRSIHFESLVAAEQGSPDGDFQRYVRERKFPGAQVTTGEEALLRAEELAAAIVLSLAREGIGVNSSGSYYAGEALEWSRLKFQRRREGHDGGNSGAAAGKGRRTAKAAVGQSGARADPEIDDRVRLR